MGLALVALIQVMFALTAGLTFALSPPLRADRADRLSGDTLSVSARAAPAGATRATPLPACPVIPPPFREAWLEP